ncbi:Imm1 family immunity protein [Phytomonospora sp. NPDC050363]|uniref:Imm1 family immunity protein n=1 Tax=Phytomonospora sp. NPDC050363 TaxID=3155642 RepID=UPI0034094296
MSTDQPGNTRHRDDTADSLPQTEFAVASEDLRGRVDFFVPGEAAPRAVETVEEMDVALDALLADGDANPARLYHRARPLLEAGGVDHELQVAVAPERLVGALRFGADGTWFTKGANPPEGVATAGAMYDYPEDSEVPLDTVRAALAEFLATHRRPTVVAWQDDPHDF